MIDLLIVVLLFAFVPIGIILSFIGCFYCFLFIQHCITYTEESDERPNGSPNVSRRGESTQTPSSFSVPVTNEPRPTWERRESTFSAFDGGGGKRLGVARITHASSDIVISHSEQPPPPYHSICFNKNVNKEDLTVQKVTYV